MSANDDHSESPTRIMLETATNSAIEQQFEVQEIRRELELSLERLSAIEARVATTEVAVAKIPSIEARLSRSDVLLTQLQGDMRRIERSMLANTKSTFEKLDAILAMVKK